MTTEPPADGIRSWKYHRARLASLANEGRDRAEYVQEKERFRIARRRSIADEYIDQLVADAPIMTPAQLERLRPLLADSPALASPQAVSA